MCFLFYLRKKPDTISVSGHVFRSKAFLLNSSGVSVNKANPRFNRINKFDWSTHRVLFADRQRLNEVFFFVAVYELMTQQKVPASIFSRKLFGRLLSS